MTTRVVSMDKRRYGDLHMCVYLANWQQTRGDLLMSVYLPSDVCVFTEQNRFGGPSRVCVFTELATGKGNPRMSVHLLN